MAAFNLSVAPEPCPNQDVAAESLEKREARRRLIPWHFRKLDTDRPARQVVDRLFDQMQALFDFADANPDARVDRRRWTRISPIQNERSSCSRSRPRRLMQSLSASNHFAVL
jgi:hypothetical protein